jgi:hypothetical protein
MPILAPELTNFGTIRAYHLEILMLQAQRCQMIKLPITRYVKLATPVICVAMLVCLFTLGAPPASADSVSFDLGTGNSAISGFPGPYATVTVDRTDSTHATITFTSLTNSGNIYLLGDGGSVDVNVNATSWTLSGINGSNGGTGFTPGPWSDGGSGQVDGFGVLNQTINSFDGFTHSSDTISFTLTNTSGTWAAAGSVLKPNDGGSEAAAHIFVTSSPANASNGALATGFAANGGLVSSPEPSSLSMFGVGLLGLLGLARRRLLT